MNTCTIFAAETRILIRQEAMQIISSREFRTHQKYYFELAEKEPVFVSRPHARPMFITPADEALTLEELQSIRRGMEDVKAGRVHAMHKDETLDDFLNRVSHV